MILQVFLLGRLELICSGYGKDMERRAEEALPHLQAPHYRSKIVENLTWIRFLQSRIWIRIRIHLLNLNRGPDLAFENRFDPDLSQKLLLFC